MSILSLILIVVFSISTISAVIVVAACVASSRSQRIASAKMSEPSVEQGSEHLSASWRKPNQTAGSRGWLRSTNVVR